MTHKPLAMLGGLTAEQFMHHHWQKRPLLVKQAFPGIEPPVSAANLKKLSKRDDVQSRLIWQEQGQWQLEHGPFGSLPGAKEPNWTLLVQSLDIHSDSASALLHQFNFVPSARLDDLMASIATQGGGVGPHFDSYDVFLIQAQGQRHWKFGQQKDLTLIDGLPLKILKNFTPQEDAVLEPGDMLYLPPHAAHDGIALTNDCMTLSVGFRAPDMATLAQGMLEAAAEQIAAREHGATSPMADPPLAGPDLSARLRDPEQAAVTEPALIPDTMINASINAVKSLRFDHALACRFLGCWLTEPNPLAVFEPSVEVSDLRSNGHLVLDRRTRMIYRDTMLFINGELASIKPNAILKRLANHRNLHLTQATLRGLSMATRDCLLDWLDAGWLHLKS
ncbi:ribosomal protein uL16 3-hydroxylase [Orrella daihaiensis]|uniref:Cupin domain-containing protein n=1 Tax=Orrella daihaiensis TaxID=2782176 RepID=A0ABY4ALJ4_9BURK|nr:cupin domain-containing protein [Orrella daihaiensis]UOD51164.1 cupin domain-containing protein [Orrella daihaiensis]